MGFWRLAPNRLVMKHSFSERGATIVEYVISIPLLILVILIFTWFGVTANAKASLNTAMGTALRLASTRGDQLLVGQQIMGELDTWDGSSPEAVQSLLAHGTPGADLVVLLGKTIEPIAPSGGPVTLANIPAKYLYTLAYLTQSLRSGIGDSVRIPCSEDLSEAPGCVSCKFVNPCQYQPEGATCEINPTTLEELGIGLTCSFRPAFPLIGAIDALLGIVTGGRYAGTVVTRTKFYPAVD